MYRPRPAAPLAVAAIAVLGVVVAPATASAYGGNCGAAVEKHVNSFSPDTFRVRASCSYLSYDSKAQGQLVVPYHSDFYTPWFTRLNTNYYSGWTHSVYGTPSASTTVQPV